METLPTQYFVLTPGGVVAVPTVYIQRNHRTEIEVTASRWRSLAKSHKRLNSSTMTSGQILLSRCIVVLHRPDAKGEGLPRTLWFVRFAVQGGSDHFESQFGRPFLFELGYPTACRVLHDLKEAEDARNTPPQLSSSLRGSLRATADTFHIGDWPGCYFVKTVDCFYERVFLMSVKPTAFPYSRKNEGDFAKQLSHARQETWQFALELEEDKGGGKRAWPTPTPTHTPSPRLCGEGVGLCLGAVQLTQDAGDVVVRMAAAQLAASPCPSNWPHLLAMRAVNRAWRDVVDDEAARLIRNLLRLMRVAHCSERMEDLVAAREAILAAGFVTLDLVCDHRNPSIYNWIRLRSGKAPNEEPAEIHESLRPLIGG